MLTLDQIEDLRVAGSCALSLQQAAEKSGTPFRRCEECRGRGFTKATLLLSAPEMRTLSTAYPDANPAIQYERCPHCSGSGGFVSG
jgi:DnaJ-class molecular chaperone